MIEDDSTQHHTNVAQPAPVAAWRLPPSEIPHGVCSRCGAPQMDGKGCVNDECPMFGSFD